jgi:hypothetical protein
MLPYAERLVLVKRSIRPGPRQPARLNRLADEAKIDAADLEMWLDAYEAGGESGLRAVETPAKSTAGALKGTSGAITVWLETSYGPLRNFKVGARDGRISVAETPGDGSKAVDRFQLRAGDENGWHLYFKRGARWWPYNVGEKRGKPRFLDDVLHDIMTDPQRLFWTAPGMGA